MRAALGVLVVGLATGCATDGPITWEDLDEPAAKPQVERAAPQPTPPPPAPAIEETPPASVAAAQPPIAVAVAVAVDVDEAAAPVFVLGANAKDGEVISVDALVLVCLSDARGLTETRAVLERLDEEAKKQGATLGELRLVRFSRDPTRSLTDPPPRVCRPLIGDAALKAPLIREREDAGSWLVTTRGAGSIVDDAQRSAARLAQRGAQASAPPRIVVDLTGARLGVAQPIASSPAAAAGPPPTGGS